MCTLRKTGRETATLKMIKTRSSEGRRGVGTLLMKFAKKQAFGDGAREMRLDVDNDNAVAVAFYMQLG